MQQLVDQIAGYEALDIPSTKQPDFADFWIEALRRCEEIPLNIKGGTVDYPLPGVTCRDITFEGLDGTPIHTWLLLPSEAKKAPVPAVVHFHGAGWHRGDPVDFCPWLMNGIAVISPDFRMQRGNTGSNTGFAGNSLCGLWIAGITDLKNSYSYCTWTDCLRAIRLARETEEIDNCRIAVESGSQGGAMALATAALDQSAALCMADVPSSCWMDERIYRRAGRGNGIADYLKAFPDRVELVSRALSYFDNLNHAPNITCPTLVSCGLKDPVCPPECVYAAYNKITAEKEMVTYPFAEHEGGGNLQLRRKLDYIRNRFGML